MSSKMILPTFFGFIKSQLQFHDILKKCFFTNINSKTEKGKNPYCLFLRHWCIMSNDNFFFIKRQLQYEN